MALCEHDNVYIDKVGEVTCPDCVISKDDADHYMAYIDALGGESALEHIDEYEGSQ